VSRRVGDTVTREPSGTAGTDAERRAAHALADELRGTGREARVQTVWVRTAWWAPQALAVALGVAASVLAVGDPIPGVALAAVALLVALADLSALAPVRRLTPARATQNVVSAPADVPPGAITLIVTAAVDRARSGLGRRFPGGVLRWSLGALALVLACCGVRAAGIEETWVGAVQLLPTVVLLACLLAFLDEAVADPVDGDRGAVAAAVALTAELDAAPPEHLAVAVVLAGAGGAQSAGLRAWLRGRRARGLAPGDVALLHLEPVPGPQPGWWARDGLVVTSALHPQLLRAARAAAEAEPDLEAHVRRRPRGTAAAVARAGGWPAIAVGVGDPEAGTRFASALVRALDTELRDVPPHEAVQSTDPA
jgi:hypothetical protein